VEDEVVEERPRKRKRSDYKSFSKHSWRDVKKMMRLVRPVTGDIFPQIEVLDLDACVEKVLFLWATRARLTGFPGDTESLREYFIIDVLLSIPCTNLGLALQYPVGDEQFGGTMDIVLHADTPSTMPVVYVVEAKKEDMNQGRAQLYPQLKVCHELARKEENWNHSIFGAISTAVLWIFVRYDGKKWVESKPCFVQDASDRDGVRTVVGSLYRILIHQDKLVEDMVASFREEMESGSLPVSIAASSSSSRPGPSQSQGRVPAIAAESDVED